MKINMQPPVNAVIILKLTQLLTKLLDHRTVPDGDIKICYEILHLLQAQTENPLPEECRAYLTSLGSSFATLLGPRLVWYWAFFKGGKTLSEGLTIPYGLTVRAAIRCRRGSPHP